MRNPTIAPTANAYSEASVPLSNEMAMVEATTLFTEQHLGTLDIDGFVALLHRFPEHDDLAAHVLRQGVRDHSAGLNHNVAVGEVHHGLDSVLTATL